ncbi:MAG: hypothetical protein FWG87_00225 [Defluviitaleaceae bacterium]|nr:hypothetical protein [Defluviitaleaceae bacterium]
MEHPKHQLTEQELDAISGGATKDRYDRNECYSKGFRTNACMRNVIVFANWCDHFRQEMLEKGAQGTRLVRRSCYFNCFEPFTTWTEYQNSMEKLN